MSSKTIKLDQLSFGYNQKNLIFSDLSLKLEQNKFILLTGPSGSGKSSLLGLISGLNPKFGGTIYHGKILNAPTNWGMVFQEPDTQFTMSTPRQEMIFALENLQIAPSKALKIIESAIIETHIQDLADHKFTELSGGEKQRVAFAIILAMNPDTILLDEPFSNCDPQNRKFLLHKLKLFKNLNKTIIISDHILNDYENLYDQILKVENNTVTKLTKEKILSFFQKENLQTSKSFSIPDTSKKEVFNLKNFSLSRRNRKLIDQTSLKIYSGVGTLLTGDNGTGKSSFFAALTKMLNYNGTITYLNQDIQYLKNRNYLLDVNQAFQNANDQFLMITVKEEISLSKNRNSKIDESIIKYMLTELNLDTCLDRVVYSLSGGQKKKLQLLILIITSPKVLLLDEPYSGLDKESIYKINQLLKKYFLDFGNSLLLISHQNDYIDQICTYHLELSNKHFNYIE